MHQAVAAPGRKDSDREGGEDSSPSTSTPFMLGCAWQARREAFPGKRQHPRELYRHQVWWMCSSVELVNRMIA